MAIASKGWLQAHQTTPSQIADLLAMVDRDLEDSMRDLSPDWQFGIAYNAALKLCTILLYASGCRPEKNLAHDRTLAATGNAKFISPRKPPRAWSHEHGAGIVTTLAFPLSSRFPI
jgi:hypothetical protein